MTREREQQARLIAAREKAAAVAAEMQERSEQSTRERRIDGQARQYMGDVEKDRHECLICGSLVVERFIHAEWHEQIDAAIAANRPDPRSAFIGG